MASAGHCWPVVRRASGLVEQLRQAPAPPLGVGLLYPAAERPAELALPFLAGDLAVLYTDGLVERRRIPLDAVLGWVQDVVSVAQPAGRAVPAAARRRRHPAGPRRRHRRPHRQASDGCGRRRSDSRLGGEGMSKNVTPVTVALVNDYELVLAGVATMLRPYRDHLVVLDRALERTPDRAVDVSLFDTYGAADDQLDRVKTLAEDRMSGAVVVFSFSTAPQLVTAALGAGAGGFVSKTVNGRQLADAIVTVADSHRVVLTPTPRRARRTARSARPGRVATSARDGGAARAPSAGLHQPGDRRAPVPQREHGQDTPPAAVPPLGVSNRTQAAMVATGGRGVPASHRHADAGGSRRRRRLIRRSGSGTGPRGAEDGGSVASDQNQRSRSRRCSSLHRSRAPDEPRSSLAEGIGRRRIRHRAGGVRPQAGLRHDA